MRTIYSTERDRIKKDLSVVLALATVLGMFIGIELPELAATSVNPRLTTSFTRWAFLASIL